MQPQKELTSDELQAMRVSVHVNSLRYRALDRLLTNGIVDEIAVIWPGTLRLAVERNDVVALKKLVVAYSGSRYGDAGLRELFEMAKRYSVNVNLKMTRLQLLRVIAEGQRNEGAETERREKTGVDTAGRNCSDVHG